MRTEQPTKCFVPYRKLRAKLSPLNRLKPPPPAIYYRPCQGGSSVVVLFCLFFGVRVSMTFHLMYVHIISVRFRLLSGHLLGKGCSLG